MSLLTTETPWGPSQSEETIAEGIDWYTTASHGGCRISPERQGRIQQVFPGWTSWAGGAWYEEDCDWAVVVLVFPECFDAAARQAALRTLERPDPYFASIQSSPEYPTLLEVLRAALAA